MSGSRRLITAETPFSWNNMATFFMSEIFLLAYASAFLANGQICMSNSLSSFQEGKIRSILAGFFRCDPDSVSVVQMKDGVINCYNNTDYKITVEGKNYFAKLANPNGKILGTYYAKRGRLRKDCLRGGNKP